MMRGKRREKNAWLNFTLWFTVAGIAVGILGVILVRSSYTSSGIESVHTLEELQQLDIVLDCSMVGSGTEKEERLYEHYKEKADSYIDQLGEADTVCVVASTGRLEFYRGSFCQEVTVKQVISDASGRLKPGDTVKLFGYSCLEVKDGRINYVKTDNLFNPDREYLVFLMESELNEIGKRKNYGLTDSPFASVCLDRESGQSVCQSNDFWENWGIDKFFLSQKLMNQHREIEEKVIARYGGAR